MKIDLNEEYIKAMETLLDDLQAGRVAVGLVAKGGGDPYAKYSRTGKVCIISLLYDVQMQLPGAIRAAMEEIKKLKNQQL